MYYDAFQWDNTINCRQFFSEINLCSLKNNLSCKDPLLSPSHPKKKVESFVTTNFISPAKQLINFIHQNDGSSSTLSFSSMCICFSDYSLRLQLCDSLFQQNSKNKKTLINLSFLYRKSLITV